MVNCQLLIVMPVIRTQRDIPPAPPSKGGRAKAKGDVTPSKGECSAVSIQPSVCHVGANHLFALFLCDVRTQRDIPPPPLQRGERAKRRGDVIPSKGGRAGRSVGGTGERLRRSSLRPRAVSRRSSEQGERKSGCPKRSKLPDFPTCERREGVRSARSLDLWVTFGSSQK